jgi:hypothetical protein
MQTFARPPWKPIAASYVAGMTTTCRASLKPTLPLLRKRESPSATGSGPLSNWVHIHRLSAYAAFARPTFAA